jgi:hypothetical protein
MNQETIPPEINNTLAGERLEFVTKSKRNKKLSSTIGILLFSIIWIGFTSVFIFLFFDPLLKGQEVNFTVNNAPTTASLDNMGPLVMPGIIIGIFFLIGIFMLIGSISSLFSKGSWFIGTPKRLIVYRKNYTQSIDWEQFSGNIIVSGPSNNNTISLEMRTGHMVSQKNRADRYVPNMIEIIGINNGFEIEPIIRKRVKENDPTPPLSEINKPTSPTNSL